MELFLILALGAIEAIALLNRGGGPLVSHLVLTGITVGLVAIWIFMVIWKGSGGKKSDKVRVDDPGLVLNKKVIVAYVAYGIFYAAFLVSFLFSRTPEYGLSEMLLFGNAGLLFVVISQTSFSEKWLTRLRILIITLGVAEVLWGIFLYMGHPFPRFAGTFLDLAQPYTSFGNDFGDFMLFPIFISIGFLFKKYERASTTILIILITALLGAGFVLSFSRAAWLSLAFMIIFGGVWTIFFRKKLRADSTIDSFAKNLLKVVLVFLVSTALISLLQATREARYYQVTPLIKKATFSASEGTASVSERALFWKGAVQMIEANPIFGTGVQSFRYEFPKYQTIFGMAWDHPHNIALKIGVENGLIAAVSFFVFLGVVLISIYNFARKNNPFHSALPFVFAACAALLHNLLDYNFIVSNFVLTMCALAVGFSYATRVNKAVAGQKNNHKVGELIVLGIAGIASVFFLVFAVHDGYLNIAFKNGRAALEANKFDEAVTQLEQTQKLFFPRDSKNYLALAYRKQFEKTKDPKWHSKEKALLEGNADSLDATIWSRVAEIFEEDKDYRAAYTAAVRALKLDPQNRLKYYFNVLNLAKLHPEVETQDAADAKQAVIAILNDYFEQLKADSHNTVITDNPIYAFKIYGLLGNPDMQKKFSDVWKAEYLKFVSNYGAPTENIIY